MLPRTSSLSSTVPSEVDRDDTGSRSSSVATGSSGTFAYVTVDAASVPTSGKRTKTASGSSGNIGGKSKKKQICCPPPQYDAVLRKSLFPGVSVRLRAMPSAAVCCPPSPVTAEGGDIVSAPDDQCALEPLEEAIPYTCAGGSLADFLADRAMRYASGSGTCAVPISGGQGSPVESFFHRLYSAKGIATGGSSSSAVELPQEKVPQRVEEVYAALHQPLRESDSGSKSSAWRRRNSTAPQTSSGQGTPAPSTDNVTDSSALGLGASGGLGLDASLETEPNISASNRGSSVVLIGEKDSEGLRKLAWGGVPTLVRPRVWRHLLGYAPTATDRFPKEINRKRSEYHEYASLYHTTDIAQALPHEQAILRQLEIDLPRHRMAMYHMNPLVRRMSRCLYLWAIRYPAAGYVQGMDDIVAVFFLTFLAEALYEHSLLQRKEKKGPTSQSGHQQQLRQGSSGRAAEANGAGLATPKRSTGTTPAMGGTPNSAGVSPSQPQRYSNDWWPPFGHRVPFYSLTEESKAKHAVRLACATDGEELGLLVAELDGAVLDAVEADTYWCAGRMLSWVQDHFTQGQPAVHKLIAKLRGLVCEVDADAVDALEEQGILFVQFGFQWLHCLLVRELPLHLSMQLWDTYLALGEGFATFHVYVCAALFLELKPLVLNLEAPDQIQHQLKNPLWRPEGWPGPLRDEQWLETLVSQAYLLQLQHPNLEKYSTLHLH